MVFDIGKVDIGGSLHLAKMLDDVNLKIDVGKNIPEIKTDLGNLGFDSSKLDIQGETINYEGKTMKITELSDSIKKGDMGPLFELSGEKLDATAVKSYNTRFLDANPGAVEIKNLETAKVDGGKIQESIDSGNVMDTEVNTPEKVEVETKINEGKTENAKLDEDINKINEEVKKNSDISYGTYVKTSVKLGIIASGVFLLTKFIKEHQKAMNGCWMINLKTGDKCKVTNLCCGDTNKSGKMCEQTPTSCTQYNNRGEKQENKTSCFTDAACVTVNESGNCAETISSKGDKCKGKKTCSIYCDSSKIEVPEGFQISCVNVDFYGAMADVVATPFNVAGDLIKKVINIAKYIFFGVVILIGLIIIYKMIDVFIIQNKNKQNNNPPSDK